MRLILSAVVVLLAEAALRLAYKPRIFVTEKCAAAPMMAAVEPVQLSQGLILEHASHVHLFLLPLVQMHFAAMALQLLPVMLVVFPTAPHVLVILSQAACN
jgi:hypothetical protein